ncbi:gas vesicle protein GvpG [Micromonospora sp. C28SCA-DRY-2]|uniref:gas vesicle protein GvpG n=1 Tax=Micromonospora sp. C28SCA-DRY-2 TaxID=3059522 RepID=UPI002674DEA7|nr:gas vesicle protein GvpG [Micromonospora sp. C28SCA-DRY-2]MDO3703804.1 gas vesicle protein GvpG [Micromonospora sp. C28SCA-DRY-2]
MDILWALLTLPYAPVRGLTAVVKVIAREAEAQRYSPTSIRRELEELDEAAAAGDITPEERDRGQQEVLDRLTGTAGRRPAPGGEAETGGARGRPAARRGRQPVRRGNGRARPVVERARRAGPGAPRDGGEGGERGGGVEPRRRPGR